jgi:hypothetical protein
MRCMGFRFWPSTKRALLLAPPSHSAHPTHPTKLSAPTDTGLSPCAHCTLRLVRCFALARYVGNNCTVSLYTSWGTTTLALLFSAATNVTSGVGPWELLVVVQEMDNGRPVPALGLCWGVCRNLNFPLQCCTCLLLCGLCLDFGGCSRLRGRPSPSCSTA